MSQLPHFDEVLARLQAARHVLFITGAGLSADSGLPTYRGIGGLYNEQNTEDGLPIEVALSAEVMHRNPEITWKYLARIEAACREAGPNPAHHAIARLQDHCKVTVLTQNIDGFHARAGSRNLIEMHGDLFHLYCERCGHASAVENYSAIQRFPPPCPQCAHHLRPRVVLFNEMLPAPALQQLDAVFAEGYDLVFSVGTTSVFPYIAQPFVLGAQWGALAIEINPDETAVSRHADICWRSGAAASLSTLIEALLRHPADN